jgi:branched-chain amino acid aminotransferase
MAFDSLTVFANGRFCRYDEAKIGLMTHALHYGTGCFEGARGYWNEREQEVYFLFLREHYERLHASAKILMMSLPYSVDELIEITLELCRRNEFRENLYLRPFVYKSQEMIGVRLHDVADTFALIAMPFSSYFETDDGLKATVSAWRRIDDNTAPARAKVTGVYVNSALAKSEAILDGFDEAIMLSADGHVSEGSAENIFIVRRGELITPDVSQNILEGCTRRAVMTIARDELHLTVVERAIDRTEIFTCEELFFTGSAAGVQWVKAVDHRSIGDGTMGPITEKIHAIYEGIMRHENPKYASWLTPAYAKTRA